MEFGNEMQKNVYAMLASWFADDIRNGTIQMAAETPRFYLKQGSAFIYVSVNPFGDSEAVITVGARVVIGANITPELMQFLLGLNLRQWFGAFSLNEETGVISFDHSIVGSTCDQKELATSMSAVADAADKYDDTIIKVFGGKSGLAEVTGQ